MKRVGIVLVNYKDYAKRFLAICRDSLLKQIYYNFKVYIIDNASSEDSRRAIAEIYPEAKMLERDNGNYAAANNLGLRQALFDGAEIVVIANMDTVFKDDWLFELVAGLESGENVGIAQSKILVYPPKGEMAKINSLGNHLHFLGFGFTSNYLEVDREIAGYPQINGYASGCSFAIKKEVLEKIGGYSEEYYMYHDDLEVSWKAKLAGYKIVLAPKSVCYHKFEFSRSIKKIYYMERNRFLFIFSFYELKTILFILPALAIMETGQLFFACWRGWLWEKLKSYVYFLRPLNWQRLLAERKIIQHSRVVADKCFVRDMASEISSQDIDNTILKHVANPFFNAYWQVALKFLKN